MNWSTDTNQLSRSASWQSTRRHSGSTGVRWRKKRITHWACTEAWMTKEDKITATWRPPMDRGEDGQPQFGGTCVISRQPAFSVPFDDLGYHETMEWLTSTKRFSMVRIPTENGSRTVAVMVILCLDRKEQRAQPEESSHLRHNRWTCGGHGNLTSPDRWGRTV